MGPTLRLSLAVEPAAAAQQAPRALDVRPQTILANLVKQGVATKEGQQYTVTDGKA